MNEFVPTYVKWIDNAKTCIEDINMIIKAFNQIVNAAKNEVLSEYLFPVDSIEEFLTEQDSDYNFIKGNFNKIAVLNYNYYEGKIIMVVSIPALDQDTFILYKIHSIPVFQESCSRIIKTSYPYIVIGKDSNLYVLMSENKIADCIKSNKYVICPPLKKFSLEDSCERSMLVTPQYSSLKFCNYGTPNSSEYWQLLSSNDG